MSFWTKIKKQISRTGHKLGLDVNHDTWNAMFIGRAAGTGTGALMGLQYGGVGAIVGAAVGGEVGQWAGFTTGKQLQKSEEAAEDYQESLDRIAAAAEAETVELTTNESQDVANQNDDRAARLASAYSLSNTRSVTGKQLATSTSVKRSARGRSTLG